MEILEGPFRELRKHGLDAAADALEQTAQSLQLPQKLFDLYTPFFDAEKKEAATLITAMEPQGKMQDELQVMKKGYARLLQAYARRMGASKYSTIEVDLSNDQAFHELIAIVQDAFSTCTQKDEYPYKVPAGKPQSARWDAAVVAPRAVKATVEGLGLHGKAKPQWLLASEMHRNDIGSLIGNACSILASEPYDKRIQRLGLVRYERSTTRNKMPPLGGSQSEFFDVEQHIGRHMRDWKQEREAEKRKYDLLYGDHTRRQERDRNFGRLDQTTIEQYTLGEDYGWGTIDDDGELEPYNVNYDE